MSNKRILTSEEKVDVKGKNIIFIGENNDDMPFVCQYIVCKGSNDDPIEKNGVAHLIEHYLIKSAYNNSYFKKTKIHGFTSFYYTCYYWYVSTHNEAIISFQEFNKIINEVKKENLYKDEDFREAKKEVLDEINYFADKNAKLTKLLSVLANDIQHIPLPIGNVENFRNINHAACVDYLNSNYNFSNIFRYVYNRKYEILEFKDSQLKNIDVIVSKESIKENLLQDDCKFENIKISCFNHFLENNTVKIIFKNNFYESLYEIILGEIFLMQICDYMRKYIVLGNFVEYENFFVSNNQLYSIISLSNLKHSQYTNFIKMKEVNLFPSLNKIIEISSFQKHLNMITEFIINYDRTEIKEKEIRMDLINYAALSYISYNLAMNKAEVLNVIKSLRYDEYRNYVLNKVKLIDKENIKIIY